MRFSFDYGFEQNASLSAARQVSLAGVKQMIITAKALGLADVVNRK
jgi:hypothetical protein